MFTRAIRLHSIWTNWKSCGKHLTRRNCRRHRKNLKHGPIYSVCCMKLKIICCLRKNLKKVMFPKKSGQKKTGIINSSLLLCLESHWQHKYFKETEMINRGSIGRKAGAVN